MVKVTIEGGKNKVEMEGEAVAVQVLRPQTGDKSNIAALLLGMTRMRESGQLIASGAAQLVRAATQGRTGIKERIAAAQTFEDGLFSDKNQVRTIKEEITEVEEIATEETESPVGYVTIALAIIVLAGLIALIFVGAKEVDAKTREPEPTITSICRKVKEPDGEFWNDGKLYIIKKGVMQFGWVRYKGNTYYCHCSASEKYPRGSAVRGEMRIRHGNKWYAFGSDGRMITEDYYIRKGRFKKRLSLKIRKNHTVQYVYNDSACFGYRRYSTKERRYQEEQPSGRWETVPGMQFIPDYVDTQK